MSRPLSLLLGPELLWLIFYALVVLLIKTSGAPSKNMDQHWINLAYIIPLVVLPLTFALYYVPGVEHNWLLLRVLVTGLLGTHFVLERGLKAHTEQGPGVGMAYIMGIIFALIVMIIGSIFVKIKF